MAATVKICGITSAEAVDAAVRAGAVYGGLVFHRASPRHLEIVQATQLAEQMRGRLKIVALVADAVDIDLSVIAHQIKPDFFQLHGNESAARTADIRNRFGVPVIKALGIADAADLDAVAAFEPVADMLLLDARAPRGAARAGGHGLAFDWSLLKGRVFNKPWFLAGGLDPENVARALDVSGAVMADVSSGVESAPGVKSAARIGDFIAAARQTVQA